MAERLGIGIVGYGYWGPNLARNCVSHPDIDLRVIADLNTTNLQKAHKDNYAPVLTTEYADILNDPKIDAVVIAVPANLHYSLGKEALENGKHLMMEKPYTLTSAEAEDLLESAEKRGLKTFVDHPFPFSSPVEKMKEYLSLLGKTHHISLQRLNRGIFRSDVNVFWDLMPHDLSILDYLLDGLSPTQVNAIGTKRASSRQLEYGSAQLIYPAGIAATIEVGWLPFEKIRKGLISGEKGTIIYDDTEKSEKIKLIKGSSLDESIATPFNPLYVAGDAVVPYLDSTEPLRKVMDAVVKSISENSSAINDGYSGLRIIKLLERIDQALKNEKEN